MSTNHITDCDPILEICIYIYLLSHHGSTLHLYTGNNGQKKLIFAKFKGYVWVELI